MRPEYSNQSGLFQFSGQTCHIVGAGHVGTFVALGLTMLHENLRIHVYDADTVDPRNLPSQFFQRHLDNAEIPKEFSKVALLNVTLTNLFSASIATHQKMVNDITDLVINPNTENYIFLCVDSNDARRSIGADFFSERIVNGNRVKGLIDGRTGGENINIFAYHIGAATVTNTEYYMESLEGEFLPLACGGRAVVDVAMETAAEMIQRFRKMVNGEILIYHSYHDMKLGGSATPLSFYDLPAKHNTDKKLPATRMYYDHYSTTEGILNTPAQLDIDPVELNQRPNEDAVAQ